MTDGLWDDDREQAIAEGMALLFGSATTEDHPETRQLLGLMFDRGHEFGIRQASLFARLVREAESHRRGESP